MSEKTFSYEERYNEALEKARMYRDNAKAVEEYAAVARYENIFPELRESEDEKIRKAIIKSIEEDSSVYEQEVSKEQMLAWLEKQKEQKPVEWNKKPCLTCQEYKKGFEAGRLEGLTAGYNKAMGDLLKDKIVETQDYSGLTDLERAIHRGFLCAGVENVPVEIIKETAQDCLAHFPAEWSEEDKSILEALIYDIERLPMQGVLTHRPCDSYIKFLKALRPGWKPSDEQMKALNFAVIYLFSTKQNPTYLRDLYDDLLKLKNL